MCLRSSFTTSPLRLTEQAQLRAEEEWMLETLPIIKQQKDCLEGERLKLQNIKLYLEKLGSLDDLDKAGAQSVQQEGGEQSTPSPPQQQSQLSNPTELKPAVDMMSQCSSRQRNDEPVMEDDSKCTNGKLNLNLNYTSSYSHTSRPTASRNESFSDDDTSSSDEDNVQIRADR